MPSVQRGPGFHGGTPPTRQGNGWGRADASSAHECRQTTALPGKIGGIIARTCVEITRIRRLRSSNTTRRYLDRVLQSLAVLPLHLVKSGLEVLAEDTSFSSKMRAKFRNCCERTCI